MEASLFSGSGFRASEIGEAEFPDVQRFFEANPEYFLRVCGQPAGAGEAREEFDARPPEDWPWRARWYIGFVDGGGPIVGVVDANPRAGRFWEKCGYAQVCTREGVEIGRQVNTMRVMIKPLASGRMAEYLEIVERDRPGAP